MIQKGQSGARTTDGDEAVRVSHVIQTSVEAVFDAWTKPALLEKWFGPPGSHAEILTHDLRVGGQWRFLMKGPGRSNFHHFGSFVEISPPHRLVFTWASEEQVEGWRDENGDPTLVTVEIARHPDGAKVTLIHERLQSDRARRALEGGWGGSLESLDSFLKIRGNQ